MRLPRKCARGEGPLPFPPKATGSSTMKISCLSMTVVVAQSLSATTLALAILQVPGGDVGSMEVMQPLSGCLHRKAGLE